MQGTIKVLEASRYAVKKFVYAASASCYGKTKGLTNENQKLALNILMD